MHRHKRSCLKIVLKFIEFLDLNQQFSKNHFFCLKLHPDIFSVYVNANICPDKINSAFLQKASFVRLLFCTLD